jgi:hypothetical protein
LPRHAALSWKSTASHGISSRAYSSCEKANKEQRGKPCVYDCTDSSGTKRESGRSSDYKGANGTALTPPPRHSRASQGLARRGGLDLLGLEDEGHKVLLKLLVSVVDVELLETVRARDRLEAEDVQHRHAPAPRRAVCAALLALPRAPVVDAAVDLPHRESVTELRTKPGPGRPRRCWARGGFCSQMLGAGRGGAGPARRGRRRGGGRACARARRACAPPGPTARRERRREKQHAEAGVSGSYRGGHVKHPAPHRGGRAGGSGGARLHG